MTPSNSAHPTGRPDIILYGGPGSGKSTQAKLLVSKLSAEHINMGGLLRKLVVGRSRDAVAAKKIMLAGKLVPNKITDGLISKIIQKLPASRRVVLDGYPRSLAQAKFLNKLLANHGREVVMVFVKLPLSVARERLMKRATVEHRPDDLNAAALTARIRVFLHEAKSLSGLYRANHRLITVDGNQTPAQVHSAILKALKSW